MPDAWFQKALKAAKGLVNTQGEDFIIERLSDWQGVNEPPRKLNKDQEYITVRIKSSRIVDIRHWTSKFYGCVQSRASYLHADRGRIEYQTVLVPNLMKELDPNNLDRTVQIDKPVLGPVPYLGGLSLELGLFSVKGSDLAGPYIDLLTSLAQLSGVSFFMQAQPYVEPLRRGADLLFGNTNQSQLEIGLDRNWQEIETGYWLLMRAPKGSVSIADLRLDPGDFRLTDTQGRPYRNHPYLVLAFEGERFRDDWMEIPEIKQAWDAIGIAAKAGKLNDAELCLNHFVLISTWSPDLVPDDAKRLAKKARERLPQLQKETAIARLEAESHPLGDLNDLNLYDR